MSKYEISTLSNERRFFFKSLKSQPLFTISHIPFLIASVFSKARNYLREALSSPHRGSKSWPPFLSSGRMSYKERDEVKLMKLNLPSLDDQEKGSKVEGNQFERLVFRDENDPEFYFMENRWGSLLEAGIDKKHALVDCSHLVSTWLSEHPDKEADPAWEAYSSCERVVNLLVYLSTQPKGSDHISREVIEFVECSLKWIYQHLEYYGSCRTNNHILNNARALVVGGVAIENDFFVEAGMCIFRKCLPEMILEQGMLRERSSHYQLIVLNWILDAQLYINFNIGEDIDNALFLQRYAEKMLEAASFLCDGKGQLLALVGDVSPDLTPLNTSTRLEGLYPQCWPHHSAQSLAQCRDGWFKLTCDDGVVVGNFPVDSYPPTYPTHGHTDYTGFSWIDDGQVILGDPGRYKYTADEVSLSQKNAQGHNVPLVNGFSALSESLLVSGEWRPKPYASAKLDLEIQGGAVLLSHDGFSRSTPVKSHVRAIALSKRGLVVTDTFDGDGEVNVDLLWHFGNEFKTYDKESCTLVSDKMSVQLSFINVLTGGVVQAHSIEMFESNVSPRYGAKERSMGLKVRFISKLPVSIKTSLDMGKICAE